MEFQINKRFTFHLIEWKLNKLSGLKMINKYAFNQEQMNGIVEKTYDNIIKECKNLIKLVLL